MDNKLFKISLLSSVICLSLYSYGDDYFDPSMLESQLGIDPSQLDLSQFGSSNSVLEGEYRIQVEVNRNNFGDKTLSFLANKDGLVVPVFTPALLEEWGVNVKAIPTLNQLDPNTQIFDLDKYIQDSTVTLDMSQLWLKVTIPQVAMLDKVQGYIDPKLLDDGIPALFFNYFISGNKTRDDSDAGGTFKSDSFFATVASGLNLGPWRLRSNVSYNRSNSDGDTTSSTDFNNTYVMRALNSIRSTIMVGEITTGSDVFDSFPFKGMKLASDESMLPSSQRGFAPEISGIAQSNARVTIRQNGYVVYQTYVSPGAFTLKDVYSTGNAGDLDVTVTEEDGTEKTFTVAFSALPVMLRPGGYEYETSVGRYDGGYTVSSKESDFFLGSVAYGLPTNSTLYGGLLMAKDYFSAAVGVGVSLGSLGALSADITHSSADMGGELGDTTGQSYRVRYSKSMMTTGTSIDLTALRYSSRSYFSFADFNNYDRRLKDDVAPWLNQRQRASFTTAISQSLGNYGSIFLSGSISDYWEIDREVRQLSMGYNGNFNKINYSLRYSIDRIKGRSSWPENRQISLNISVPFSIFSNHALARNMSSSYMFTQDNKHRTTNMLSVNGTLLNDKLAYGVSQGYENKGVGASGALNASYSGSKGDISAGYNYGKHTQNINGSLSGGLVLHSGGVLLGKSMGSTMAIVEAKGAEGTSVSNDDSVINRQGYAIYPYISAYSANHINLDVNTLPDDVMLNETTKTVYPSDGAIVKVKFETKVGYQVIMSLKHSDGSAIPFGSVATLIDKDSKDVNTGIVGDNNQLFMSGLPNDGVLNVSWGNGDKQKCRVDFSNIEALPVSTEQPIRSLSTLCK